MYHNQTSFLAPTVTSAVDRDPSNPPQIASPEEISSRSIEVADQLLANNPIVLSCVRHLQHDILRQVARMEDMLRGNYYGAPCKLNFLFRFKPLITTDPI